MDRPATKDEKLYIINSITTCIRKTPRAIRKSLITILNLNKN